MSGKTTKDKDEPEESKTTDTEATQKEIDDIIAGMNADQKGRMIASMGVVDADSAGSPLTHAKYDHEDTLKNLVKNTTPVRALMDTLKDDYETVFYMGSLCDYWKTLITLDRLQINEHTVFIKYFKKERHLHGLPDFVVTPSPAGSKNVHVA